MPSLKDLEDDDAVEKFASKVVTKANEFGKRRISLNHGDCSESAFLERLKKVMICRLIIRL